MNDRPVLDVSLMVDQSGSVRGETSQALAEVTALVIRALSGASASVAEVYVSVKTFASTATLIVPATPINSVPKIEFGKAGSGASMLAPAIELFSEVLTSRRSGVLASRSHCTPVALILSDGWISDRDALARMMGRLRPGSMPKFICIGLGSRPRYDLLGVLEPVEMGASSTDLHAIEGVISQHLSRKRR